MGWRQSFSTSDDKAITEFASSVVGPEEHLVAMAAATDHRVLELLVEELGQPDLSSAVAALNKLLDVGMIIFIVTERTLALGYRPKGRSGSPEHVLTVDRGDVRVVRFGSGRLNTYLTLQAGPLVLQAVTGRWIPKRTSYSDLGAVATALGGPRT